MGDISIMNLISLVVERFFHGFQSDLSSRLQSNDSEFNTFNISNKSSTNSICFCWFTWIFFFLRFHLFLQYFCLNWVWWKLFFILAFGYNFIFSYLLLAWQAFQIHGTLLSQWYQFRKTEKYCYSFFYNFKILSFGWLM